MDNNEQPVNGAVFYMISNLFIVAFVLINLFFIVNATTDFFVTASDTTEQAFEVSLFDPEIN